MAEWWPPRLAKRFEITAEVMGDMVRDDPKGWADINPPSYGDFNKIALRIQSGSIPFPRSKGEGEALRCIVEVGKDWDSDGQFDEVHGDSFDGLPTTGHDEKWDIALRSLQSGEQGRSKPKPQGGGKRQKVQGGYDSSGWRDWPSVEEG